MAFDCSIWLSSTGASDSILITMEDTVLCTLDCNFDSCYHTSASCLMDYLRLA